MQEHPRQVGPLSVARTCAHSVQTKGSNGHYRPLVAWEEYDPRVTEAGALSTFPCGLILLWGRSEAYKTENMQHPASELRRIPLPRTSVNRVASNTPRAEDKCVIQHTVLYDTVLPYDP
jgi:hypothetical protein